MKFVKTPSQLSIIIITYNSQNQIEGCLKSIKRQGISSNIIVIDNNSADQTWQKLKKNKSGHIHLIKNKINSGFAKAVNQGIRYSKKNFKASLFLLLNPDAVLEDDCLKKLIKRIDSDQKLGLVSPVVKDPRNNETIFASGRINNWKMNTTHSIKINPDQDYLTGCCLLIKKAVIDKIDGFDERFFLYYEDADFSLRAHQAGFKIKTVQGAICLHAESSSSSSENKTYHLVKSGLTFFYKHFNFFQKLFYFWPIFYLRLLYHQLISHKKIVIKAMKDFYSKKKIT